MNFRNIKKIIYSINGYFILLILFTYPVLSKQNLNPYQFEFLILDSYVYDDRLWLVGEHGRILNSNDATNWNMVQPDDARLLTSITSNKYDRLVTAGHDANVLLSKDMGESWQLVYSNIEIEQAIFDINFINSNQVIAVGSYGLYLTSNDSGDTWKKTNINLINTTTHQENEIDFDELHFNSISISENTINCSISAEAGVVFISDNQCQDWRVIQSPYIGSFFGSEFIDDQSILFYGLRGNIYYFNIVSGQWKKIESQTTETLHSSYSENGFIYLIGYGSTVLQFDKSTYKIRNNKTSSKRNYTSLIKFHNQYYLTSDKGLETYK